LDPVDFDTFQKILNRPGGFRPAGEPDEFVRGFQVFDKDGTGYIGVGELRYVLTSLGEKLSNEEVDELLKGMEIKGDMVNYIGKFPLLITDIVTKSVDNGLG
jgi:calmodulin